MDPLDILNQLSNDELIEIHKAGRLKSFCIALSLDFQEISLEDSEEIMA